MASKSKRRRRVLGASCILAALIIAASSFAWFTSKDEVTNRLTASADYGVSIVESFSPPANWVPGQDVNKDVYDVNTGNIAAFVNNEISGVLTYTFETTQKTVDTTNGVVLNDANIADIYGATTMEGGSVLAWTNVASEPRGEKDIKADGTGWKPSASGVYIFRRSIKSSAGNPSSFTYSGYYYDQTSDKYYKISIGDDKNPGDNGVFDVSSNNLGGTATVDPVSGVVTSGDPAFYYVIETKIDAQPVTFEFDGTNKLLKFEYAAATAGTGTATYDASAVAARAEIDYANAKEYSGLADKLYANAKADLDYAIALANASNDLIDAADDYNTKYNTVNGTTGTKKIKDDAWDAIFADTTGSLAEFDDAFNTVFDNSFTAIAPATIVPASVEAAANQEVTPSSGTYVYPYVHQNYTELTALYTEMGTYKTNIETAITALDSIKSNTNKDTDPALIQAQVDNILNNIYKNAANYQKALNEYQAKYADLVTSADTDASITVATSTDTTNKNKIQDAIDDLASAKTNADDLNGDSGAYKTAYDNWSADNTAATNAETAWENALTAYNTAVSAAKDAYDTAVTTNGVGQDHGETLVKKDTGYSLTDSTTAGNKDPRIIDTTTAKDQFATYAALTKKTVPDDTMQVGLSWTDTTYDNTNNTYTSNPKNETKTVAAWLAFKNQKYNDMLLANDAYKDAENKVKTSSKITINVKLDSQYAQNWTFDTRTDNTTKASFYLNKILEAGETSKKLVDSVELDSSVTQYAYKDLIFDLNVALDSAQITFDSDNTTIKTDAVTSPAFGMKPTVDQSTKAVSWA